MKKKIVKPLLAVCCAAVLAGGIGVTAYATGASEQDGNEKDTATVLRAAEPAAELTKDETVYVLANADGSARKIIVSDWIKNAIGSASIADHSELAEVENVRGDETYTMDGGNMRVWDAQGNDIYYQGEIATELPVVLRVSYKLDGKSITAEELAGKSGKVTIRFDYENRRSETVEIDGRKEKIYVPFAVLTGMLLDNDVFTNIEVTNGKLINDGNRTAAAGIAFPGLGSNLNMDAKQLEIPDYVEITADVKEFAMANTVTIATNEIFSGLNTDALNTEDNLFASIGQLSDAMDQLTDGSSQLYDGLCALLDKSQELIAGIDRLAAGTSKLTDGAGALDAGAVGIAAGVKDLADGLGTLAASSDSLNAGAKQVFESLLATADAQLAGAGLTVPKLTIENYAQVLDGVVAQMADPTAAEQTKAAAAKLSALRQQLDSYNGFYTGLSQYTEGVASAKAGAEQLQNGAAQLQGGAAELDAGMKELNAGILAMKEKAPALVEGVTQLRDGSMRLSGGLKEFNEQGVQRLMSAVDGDIAGLITRIQATAEVSKNYRNFSGISDGMDGQVKFIYRTDAVTK